MISSWQQRDKPLAQGKASSSTQSTLKRQTTAATDLELDFRGEDVSVNRAATLGSTASWKRRAQPTSHST